MRFTPGDTVGSYRVTAKIGQGASGVVYQVVNSITGRLEAMKILANDGQHTLDQAQRFLREIQFQAKLEHPNIAQVHTGFCEGSTIVMVMEQVDGEPLNEIIGRGPLPLGRALSVISQVLCALGFAHARHVIHRDVKPSNILVARDGKVKLTDFGLARNGSDPSQTSPGAAAGTVYYMAPEQVRAHGTVDHRADIYAAAIVLHEMLTGRRPFDGPDHFSVMHAQVELNPPPPSLLIRDLPPSIDNAIARALEKDPARRFQSAAEFLDALTAQTSPSRLPAAPRSSNPWKFTAVMVATAAFLLTAFAIPPWFSSRVSDWEHLDLKSPAPPAPPAFAFAPAPSTAEPVPTPAPVVAKTSRRSRPALRRPAPVSAAGRPLESPSPILPRHEVLAPPPSVAINSPAPAPAPEAVLPVETLPEKPKHPLRRALSRFPRLFRFKPAEQQTTSNPD